MTSRNNWAILIGMSDSWPDEVTKRIAAEIKRLRGDRSGQWLSDRTAELGSRVSRSTISEIETGRRKSITVTDLIVLAAALDTAPIALVYPAPDYREKIRVMPDLRVPEIWAVQWFSGLVGSISDVPFADDGELVQVPNPDRYYENRRRLDRARQMLELSDRKSAVLRRLRALRADGGADDDISEHLNAIGEIQQRIDELEMLGGTPAWDVNVQGFRAESLSRQKRGGE